MAEAFFYLGEQLDPHLGNLPSALSIRKTGLFAFFFGTVTFLITLSFGEVNLLLGEKAMFFEEHSLLASFSLEAVHIPYGGLGLSASFSLGGTNPSPRERILPFRESIISLENRLCSYVPCRIPFNEFLPDRGSVQITDHSFFNLSTRSKQYLRTHTF